MTGLRWILLLAGLIFIAGLAWWEMRRSRQASGAHSPRLEPTVDEPVRETPAQPLAAPRLNESHRPLPVIEWPPMSADDSAPPPEPASAPRATLNWPPEGVRRICNLRLTPGRQERLAGRAVRQSLLACGFEHGEFGIFHLAGADHCVIVSAANLARPGMLDPDNMDYQRFSGINLFTVLPGSLPDSDALDQLLAIAERLAERLEGGLQDNDGRVLDAAGLAALRSRWLDTGRAAATGG